MSTSGTYLFGTTFANGDLSLEALSRCQIRGTSITQNHTADLNRSLNLALQALNNRSINLFQVEQIVLELVAGQATYTLGQEVVSIADCYYNILLSTGAGPDMDAPSYDPSEPIITNDPTQLVITSSLDRWLRPFGRSDYARVPNKQIPGLPVNYWFNRLGPPNPTTVTFWPVPFVGYPSAAMTLFCLRSAQDANLTNSETPDVPARFVDWLCANVAMRMARKYAPSLIGAPGAGGLLDDEREAWQWAAAEDTEKSQINIRMDMSSFFRV